MTLIIQKPTGANLVMRKGWQPMDADAAAYITAVETADGQALEERTKIAIDNFVLGCKEDGIWTAIKASCILAGARTLNGALVPLVGAAPTNVGPFVSGDYNRKTGLAGDGSTKYLNSNRPANLQPQNSVHLAVYGSSIQNNTANILIGALSSDAASRSTLFMANAFNLYSQLHITGNFFNNHPTVSSGFVGANRANASEITTRASQVSLSGAATSNTPPSENHFVFARNFSGPSQYSTSRLSFYSIGESLDLALLDARVTALINAIGAAIP
jgi:hypothetical protein